MWFSCLVDVSHEMLCFFFEIMFFENKSKKYNVLFSLKITKKKKKKKKKKNVVYCNLTFKVSHLALDNMTKHCALDNMNLISVNGRR